MQAQSDWRPLAGIAALLLAALTFVIVCHDEAGHTYDEEWHAQHGENVVRWYESGFQDDSWRRNFTLANYGSLFDVAGLWLSRASGMELYAARHLLGGLFAVLALTGVMRIAAQLVDRRCALIAGLLLILFGRFVGHAFNNPKDIPFAALHAWGLSALIAWERHGGRRRLFTFAACCGLLMALRLPGAILFAGFGLTLGLRWLRMRRSDPEECLPTQLRRLTFAGLCAYAIAFPFWPYFHVSPLLNPLRVLRNQTRGAAGSFPVLFEGRSIPNDELPWDYLPTWLAHVLPEPWLIGLALSLLLALRWLVLARTPMRSGWWLLGLQTLLPIVVVWVTKPMLYDGIRHFLFAVILLAVPAAAGLYTLLSLLSKPRRLAMGLLLIASALPSAYDLWALHPYQVVSFNRLVAGGLPSAGVRFETDYWGHSFREGALWLIDHHEENGAEFTPRVASSCRGFQVDAHLPDDRFHYLGSVDHELEHSDDQNPPHYYLATTRWDRHERYPGEVIHEVRRQGVTLLVVVEVDREEARRRGRRRRSR